MKILLKNITGFLLITLFICGSSPVLFGQSTDKDVSHEEAKMQIDAYALAFGRCKMETAKYKSENNPTNALLLNTYNKILQDYKKFSVNLNAKYRADEATFDKFNRKVKSAEKQLPTCIAYQRLLDANANSEKSKLQQ